MHVDHHLVKRTDIGGSCIYCGQKLEGSWKSEFSSETHYKCILCKCGKANCTEVSFMGTGHDSWSGLEKRVTSSTRVKTVERSVKILK